MKAIKASFEGLRRVSRAPGLVLAIWLASVTIAAPLAVFVLESIHSFTADSEYNQALLEGFDTGWYEEFTSSGGAIEETSHQATSVSELGWRISIAGGTAGCF